MSDAVATNALQRELDETGEVRLPAGESLSHPLFAFAGCEVRGAGVGVVDAYHAGTPLLIGFPRHDNAGGPLVPASRWRPDGFELFHQQLHSCHDAWSMGPWQTGGWPGVYHLRFNFVVSLLSPHPWDYVGIAGMIGEDSDNDPRPWSLRCTGGRLVLSLRSAAHGVLDAAWDIPPGTTTLDVVIDADLATGVVQCSLGGAVQLPPGIALTPNVDYPFSLGRLAPHPGADGYGLGSAWPHVLVSDFRLILNRNPGLTLCVFPRDGVVPTYSGGHPLPLVRQQPGSYLHVLTRGQPGGGGDVRIRDLRLKVAGLKPAILHGWCEKGITMENVGTVGGSVGFASSRTGVAYPIHMTGCYFSGHADCGVYLHRAHVATMRNCITHACRRVSIDSNGSNLHVADHGDYPPGTAASCIIRQSGGELHAERVKGDYEYTVPASFRLFKVEGRTHDGPPFKTLTRLRDCTWTTPLGVAPQPQLVSYTEKPGYTGQVWIEVDGRPVEVRVASRDAAP